LNLDAVFVGDTSTIAQVFDKEDGDFDLILFDIKLYPHDITTVCAAVRQDEKLKNTPVIFFKNKSEYIDKKFLNGANDYIIKPFSEAELLAKIKTYIHLKAFETRKQSQQLKKHIIEYKSKALKNSVETKTTFQLFEQELENKNKYIRTLKEKIKKQETLIYKAENVNREIRMENSTLKASLEKLKKNIAITKLQEEIMKLKKENKELREEIAQLNIDLAKADFMDIEEVEQELVKQKVTRWHERNR
jgi:DNA-binding response OmpR family regulator